MRQSLFSFALSISLGATLWLGVPYTLHANDSAQPTAVKAVEIGQKIPDARWTDYQGKEWKTEEFRGKKAIVYAFVGTQCPLAKMYSAKLVELQKQFEGKQVAFVAVDSNVQDSLAEMAAHARKYQIEFPFVKDPDQNWADLLGITRTPEVCVVDEKGRLAYRGKIDDQYGIGFLREQANEQPLVDAIESVLAGRAVETPITKAPGCLIGRKRSVAESEDGAAASSVTYAEQVSRILQKRCVSCHRPDEIGPMDLSNYDDASSWADMVLEVVREGRMPPWHASPDHGEFANDRRMTQEEIDTLETWASLGTPRGNPEREPEPLSFVEGWQLASTPDLVVPMAKKPFAVPAKGDVKYQYFVSDLNNAEDIWVRGMEIVPGNRAVVHHILIFVRDKNDKKNRAFGGERGFLVGYVPGTRVERMPEGMAKRIPANSELVFQVHYTPIGTAQEDLSKVGFWFADKASITHEVQTTSSVQTNLRIPPNEANYKTAAMLPEELPACDLLSMSPHMHLRGKAFRYTAVYPDKQREVLLDIPAYDFNWQTEYRLAAKKPLPAGTRIFCEAVFDNSTKNLNNPDPNSWVAWGDQTYEEMMIGYFHIAVPIDPKTGVSKPLEKVGRGTSPTPSQIFNFLDTDGDDKLLREQVPERMLPLFDRLDKNRDKVLERSELPPG
ncbi:redoxin domain-containing protein [Pirellulaceae bacterium SH467]